MSHHQEGPLDGIPRWLAPSLYTWIQGHFYDDVWRGSALNRDLLAQCELALRRPISWAANDDSVWRSFLTDLSNDDEYTFDVVNFILSRLSNLDNYPIVISKDSEDSPQTLAYRAGPSADLKSVFDLDKMLRDAGSCWTVSAQSGVAQLVRRVDPEIVALVNMSPEGVNRRAAEYLGLATQQVYGRSPTPGEAYFNCVMAVEAAAKPIISPNDGAATLGKMIGQMSKNQVDWEIDLDPDPRSFDKNSQVQAVVGMMNLLWKGHILHGDSAEQRPAHVTQRQAITALHLAATLVHWFASGCIHRRQ